MLKSVASGDAEAFTSIYLHYSHQVFDAAMLYLKERSLAHEVVQEVFSRIWEKRSALSEIKKLQDYLFIIARNIIFDQLRKAAKEAAAYDNMRQLQTDAIDNTDHPLRERQYSQLLQSAVASLPPQRKRIYQLAKEEGHSYAEIASQLHISSLTVRNQMIRALRYIRLFLQANTD
ncbi:RNA polymerase sigma-70 factor [Chitinophaga vietnamensis]|uniref:RNA polymerase sigma-70 factor n=1 Tax=Chitinophaga vietnamensis TaxID=2593957 RepID=UPI001375C829|nr:RNA polymerase sigma-70 factor [Chitinophaga vietnamensis]